MAPATEPVKPTAQPQYFKLRTYHDDRYDRDFYPNVTVLDKTGTRRRMIETECIELTTAQRASFKDAFVPVTPADSGLTILPKQETVGKTRSDAQLARDQKVNDNLTIAAVENR